jgi:hypothetical protein
MPSAVCPRCGQTSPPSEARLVTCAACGMSFDATKVAEPATRLVKREHGTRGVFRAPSMGIRASPFPIAGPGTCEFGDHYLTVNGFRARGQLLRFAAVMAGLAVAIAVGWLFDSMYLPDKMVVGIPFAIFLAGALIPLPPSKIPARFRIPYENIRSVKRLVLQRRETSTVLIQVRDFAPNGEIHFATEDPQSFAEILLGRTKR